LTNAIHRKKKRPLKKRQHEKTPTVTTKITRHHKLKASQRRRKQTERFPKKQIRWVLLTSTSKALNPLGQILSLWLLLMIMITPVLWTLLSQRLPEHMRMMGAKSWRRIRRIQSFTENYPRSFLHPLFFLFSFFLPPSVPFI
jgi:hypothetical protein